MVIIDVVEKFSRNIPEKKGNIPIEFPINRLIFAD